MRATEPESQQNAAGSAPPAGADAGGERCGGGGVSAAGLQRNGRHTEFRNIHQLLCLTQAFSSATGKKKMTVQEKDRCLFFSV